SASKARRSWAQLKSNMRLFCEKVQICGRAVHKARNREASDSDHGLQARVKAPRLAVSRFRSSTAPSSKTNRPAPDRRRAAAPGGTAWRRRRADRRTSADEPAEKDSRRRWADGPACFRAALDAAASPADGPDTDRNGAETARAARPDRSPNPSQ